FESETCQSSCFPTGYSRALWLDRPERPVDLLIPALSLQVQPCVHPRIQILELLFHFRVALVSSRVKRAILKRLAQSAPRFVPVTAVGEVARGRNRLNV